MSFLLTLGALIYTFIITHDTSGQSIDLSGLTSPVVYPYDQWTPQTWYGAVLQLPFVNESDKSGLRNHVRIMEGWKWNLIPLLVIELGVLSLVYVEFVKVIKYRGREDGAQSLEKHLGEPASNGEGSGIVAGTGTDT